MRVLVYSTLYPNAEQPQHGGFIEKRVLELRRRTGWSFEVVAPLPWFPLVGERYGLYGRYARVPAREERHGLIVHHPRYPVIPRLSWRFAPWLLAPPSIACLRAVRAAGFDFDLVDAHFLFPDGCAAVTAARALGVPVVMTARGSDVNDSLDQPLARALVRRAMHDAACTLAVAEPLAARLTALAGDGRPVPVVPNGVDHGVFRPLPRDAARATLDVTGTVILTVGNLRRLKGQHLLIEALATLRDATLLVAGDGEERMALGELAASLGVAARVRFLGAVANTDLPRLYAAADVFALASSSEGCPNVILEALACGTPVVATAVGAIPDLLPSAGLPYLVAERSAAAFAGRIAALLAGGPPREVYAARGAGFDWDRTCATLAEVMCTAVARRREVAA